MPATTSFLEAEIVDESTETAEPETDALEAALSEEELLADLPELRAPHRLRLRDRNKIIGLTLKLRELADEDGAIEIDADDERMPALLDVLADIDDFAESIATDPAAYASWAESASYEQFSALLGRYGRAVGE